MFKRVVLAIPKTKYGKNYPEFSFPPYGPWKLASYAKALLPDVEFLIVNAGLYSTNDDFVQAILEFDPDLVGISTHTSFAYQDCLDLGELLSQRNINQIWGGNHVSAVAEMAVKNRGIRVIRGQAFEGFVAYISGEAEKNIPSLVWPDNDHVVSNSTAPWLPFDQLPHLNPTLLPIKNYWIQFQTHRIGTPPFTERCFTLFTHEGCLWRDKSGGCEFCSLDARAFFPNPSYIWEEIERAVENFGPRIFVKDYGDSLSSNWDYVRALIETRPAGLKPFDDYVFEIYIRPGELNHRSQIDLLKSLGVIRIYVGFESFSDKILKNIRKGATTKSHWLTIKFLKEGDFYVLASCVLGCTGEDEITLQETIGGCIRLRGILGERLLFLQGSPIAIVPGSRAFDIIKGIEPQYDQTDMIDFEAIRLDWYRHFTRLGTPEETAEIIKRASIELGSLTPYSAIRGVR